MGRWWADYLIWVGRYSFISSFAHLFIHLLRMCTRCKVGTGRNSCQLDP